ncbi:hypothetical protein JOE59_003399 [Agromyces cerinus]|uniref:DUF4406 domain-containing protein n=1 Tax=Agromyces hippuratus TaxID=286438 RepID=A0A852X6A0_9MICO|nr:MULTISPECIES: DUF4406 domain-containing protein [Agromyces]MBM7832694.1 hypothetical protein [Agromyces cerinus]NYG21485.1 hypothetical protein [Agromyces hippuratus]
MSKPLLILIAGPYRSGTDGDPARIARNLERLEQASWPIYERGHVPMIGEWVALPILRVASTDASGHDASAGSSPVEGDVMYTTAHRLLQHCDAVLRLEGASHGADQDVRIAEARGIPVYRSIDEIPVFAADAAA